MARELYVYFTIYIICSVVSDSLWPHGLQPARLLCPWNSPDKNTGVSSHFFLQGIFPTWESSLGLLHCKQIPYYLSHQGSPFYCIVISIMLIVTLHDIQKWALRYCSEANLFTAYMKINLNQLFCVLSSILVIVQWCIISFLAQIVAVSHWSLGALLGWPLCPFEMSHSPFNC